MGNFSIVWIKELVRSVLTCIFNSLCGSDHSVYRIGILIFRKVRTLIIRLIILCAGLQRKILATLGASTTSLVQPSQLYLTCIMAGLAQVR